MLQTALSSSGVGGECDIRLCICLVDIEWQKIGSGSFPVSFDQFGPPELVLREVILEGFRQVVGEDNTERVQHGLHDFFQEKALTDRHGVLLPIHERHDRDGEVPFLVALGKKLLLQVSHQPPVGVPWAASVSQVRHVHVARQQHASVVPRLRVTFFVPAFRVLGQRVGFDFGNPRSDAIHELEVPAHVRRKNAIDHLFAEVLKILHGDVHQKIQARPT
mmetsp:Transcript_11649/g.31256  ORF Transcript_11649/g.31256 Transcript_11649/m.31256 type:complete len:219 (+) Transcript_11649:198-854(+)